MTPEWYAHAENENMLDGAERRELKRFGALCRHFAGLEVAVEGEVTFDMPTHVAKDPSVLSGPPVVQGQNLARLERARLGLEGDPVEDIEGTAEGMGMKVIGLAMPEGSEVAGAFFFESGVGPCIMTNASLPDTERAFSVAHQLCHFLADFNPYTPRICMQGESGRGKAEEDRADGFAEAFLLPAASLGPMMAGENAIGTGGRDVEALGVYYGAPVWAVAGRLRGMGYEVESSGAPGESGGREPGSGAELPRRLVRLALEARRRGIVSPLRMARLLQMSYPDAQELYSYFESGNR